MDGYLSEDTLGFGGCISKVTTVLENSSGWYHQPVNHERHIFRLGCPAPNTMPRGFLCIPQERLPYSPPVCMSIKCSTPVPLPRLLYCL